MWAGAAGGGVRDEALGTYLDTAQVGIHSRFIADIPAGTFMRLKLQRERRQRDTTRLRLRALACG